ncbi:hypothetical protein EQG41_11825 [Billgrantia azerbaijanica]|nr:hypothetical protein EQG41_11825 [Halomonas azerbaijanica]
MAATDERKPFPYYRVWDELLSEEMRESGFDPDRNFGDKERLKAFSARALKRFLLACYGEQERVRRGVGWEHLEDRAAVDLELCERFNWTPAEVRKLTEDDVIFLLHDTLAGFILPAEAAGVCAGEMNHAGLNHVLAPHVKSQE